MKKLLIAAALSVGFASAQAGTSFSLTGISVPANGFAYVKFSWNGDNDGFDLWTSSSSADPELFLLNAAGTSVLARDDDSGSGLEARISTSLGAGTYWAAIGQYDATDAEVIAGLNGTTGSDSSNPAFTTRLYAEAKDTCDWILICDPGKGDFSNVTGPQTTPPGGSTNPPSNGVPEPATSALIGLGLGIAGLLARRRRKD